MTTEITKKDILTETIIIRSLLTKPSFAAKMVPFVVEGAFIGISNIEITAIRALVQFYERFHRHPTKTELCTFIEGGSAEKLRVDDSNLMEVVNFIHSVQEPDVSDDYLIECSVLHFKINLRAASVLVALSDIKSGNKSLGQVEAIMTSALDSISRITVDSSRPTDFLSDIDDLFDEYEKHEDRIAFRMESFNEITGGGLPSKTLSVILAGTGIGKSLAMCSMAADNIRLGKKVLYLSMEMSQTDVAKRIDANLLDISLSNLRHLDRDTYRAKKGAVIRSLPSTAGLKIKEYPTGQGTANDFKSTLDDLAREGFEPDIVYVDYLGICSSVRAKSLSTNQYGLYKAITEELRALAMEYDLPVVTAGQINRAGYDKDIDKDIDLRDISRVAGIAHTADFIIVLRSSQELEEQGKIVVQQLKNRWGSLQNRSRFVVNLQRDRMKISESDETPEPIIKNELNSFFH